jgi:hypothetical protein
MPNVIITSIHTQTEAARSARATVVKMSARVQLAQMDTIQLDAYNRHTLVFNEVNLDDI